MSFDNFALQSGGKHIDFDVPAQMNMTSSCDNEVDYNRLKESINIQVFKIKSNVQGINRLADKIGTTQDNLGLQESLCVGLARALLRLFELSSSSIQGESNQ
ncbi:hypothetical protein QFC22_005468 [Naganishia vaughanmartiniae]|uniref:Uncharacterized protein n=1 Tax=Naganishia vaughanmartiniae TaxID=1424756 RepID=A0ACC2WUG1_9TREE|nr:hypothetical protein QFC22_005468 [Naganishia vaughanmartiniae]